MKIKRLLPPVFLILGILGCLNSAARADEEADRAALRNIRTNYETAVNTGDLSRLAPYLSKEVTGVMVTGEAAEGLPGLEAYWKKIQNLIGPGGSYHVTVNVDKTVFFGEVAVSRGSTEDVVRLGNGKELKFNSFWTAVCHQEDGTWKVFRMQACMNPVENVFISARLAKAGLIYGGGGFLGGALLIVALRLCKPGGRSAPARPATS